MDSRGHDRHNLDLWRERRPRSSWRFRDVVFLQDGGRAEPLESRAHDAVEGAARTDVKQARAKQAAGRPSHSCLQFEDSPEPNGEPHLEATLGRVEVDAERIRRLVQTIDEARAMQRNRGGGRDLVASVLEVDLDGA